MKQTYTVRAEQYIRQSQAAAKEMDRFVAAAKAAGYEIIGDEIIMKETTNGQETNS